MKIALAQLNYHIGNFEQNTNKIIDAIKQAQSQQVSIIVFSELSVCGYPPRDFLEFDDFITQTNDAIKRICKACSNITAIIGAPVKNTLAKGKPLFNAAYVIQNQKIISIHHKTLLPTYDIFDEYRYFEPNTTFNCIEVDGIKLAITICEDLWNVEEQPMYVINPMDELTKQNPDLIINLSASP